MTSGQIRTVLGDVTNFSGTAYMHEHLILDSPLIADRFPHILLNDVDAAVDEVRLCHAAGAGLMVDAMPISAGRDVLRLAEISNRTGVAILATTGLHHDRYYGPQHWTNRVGTDKLAALFIADLTEGIDEFDYTSPIIRRTPHRAGLVKVATSGETPDARDRRNIEAVATASIATGAPVLTHCEAGIGGAAQVERLVAAGVPATSIILSHVDKTRDLTYLSDLAATGAILELDQSLREHEHGADSITVQATLSLIEAGFIDQIVLGTDGARRSLWTTLGGQPGLAWLADELPTVLGNAGLDEEDLHKILHANAAHALRWREPA